MIYFNNNRFSSEINIAFIARVGCFQNDIWYNYVWKVVEVSGRRRYFRYTRCHV